MLGIIYSNKLGPTLLAASNDDELEELKKVYLEELRKHSMSDFLDMESVTTKLNEATLEDIVTNGAMIITGDPENRQYLSMQYLSKELN